MTNLTPDPDEIGKQLDKQLTDAFNGVGQQRTLLSGLWKRYMQAVIHWSKNGVGWQVDNASIDPDNPQRILFTMVSPNGWHTRYVIDIAEVSMDAALESFAVIEYEYHNPDTVTGKAGIQYHPDGVIQERLWYECWQQCGGDQKDAHALYLELGGQMQGDDDD